MITGEFTANSNGAWETTTLADKFQDGGKIQPWSFMSAAFRRIPLNARVRVTVEVVDDTEPGLWTDLTYGLTTQQVANLLEAASTGGPVTVHFDGRSVAVLHPIKVRES